MRKDKKKAKQYCFNVGNDVVNTNITVSAGAIEAVNTVFEALGLNAVLDSLKRDQGIRVSDSVKALVAYKMTTDGLSVRRFDEFLSDPRYRDVYSLGKECDPKSLYRICDRLGANIDTIVNHVNTVLKEQFGVDYRIIYEDWTAIFFESKTTNIIRFGKTKEHRPDRPQVTVGLNVDAGSGMNCGLTVRAGNVVDVTHFRDTFLQIERFMDAGSMVVFDAGGYSKENGRLVVEKGHDFLTRPQTNAADLSLFDDPDAIPEEVEEGLWCIRTIGNLGYRRYNFFSLKKYGDSVDYYHKKAERDYDELIEVRACIAKGKKPPEKHRNPNVFLDTKLSYTFEKVVDRLPRDKAIIWAIRHMINGREGKFTLMSSRDMTPSEALKIYRSRNDAEQSFKALKNYIDWRPARCTNDDAVKGRIMISYLVLTVLSFLRFRCSDLSETGNEIMLVKLRSFSLTVVYENGVGKRRIYSNYNAVIGSIRGVFGSFMRPVVRPEVRTNRKTDK